jgi:hypothetical protein
MAPRESQAHYPRYSLRGARAARVPRCSWAPLALGARGGGLAMTLSAGLLICGLWRCSRYFESCTGAGLSQEHLPPRLDACRLNTVWATYLTEHLPRRGLWCLSFKYSLTYVSNGILDSGPGQAPWEPSEILWEPSHCPLWLPGSQRGPAMLYSVRPGWQPASLGRPIRGDSLASDADQPAGPR